MGKMVSLFTKRAVGGHHYVNSTYGCVSPTHGELALTHVHILYFHLVHHGLQMPPQVKIKWGEVWETSEATPWDHGDQSNQNLETAHLANGVRRYHNEAVPSHAGSNPYIWTLSNHSVYIMACHQYTLAWTAICYTHAIRYPSEASTNIFLVFWSSTYI
jgi:hypothetical protein